MPSITQHSDTRLIRGWWVVIGCRHPLGHRNYPPASTSPIQLGNRNLKSLVSLGELRLPSWDSLHGTQIEPDCLDTISPKESF
jgi:hypothetical protein